MEDRIYKVSWQGWETVPALPISASLDKWQASDSGPVFYTLDQKKAISESYQITLMKGR